MATKAMVGKRGYPWERKEGESSRAFKAFVVYRDMGPCRSQKKTMESPLLAGASSARIGRWSVIHSWMERATQYDDYLEAIDREFSERSRRERALRHASSGQRMENIGLRKLNSKRFRKRIAPREVVALIKTGIDIQREALGDAKDNRHPGTVVNVNVLTGIADAVAAERAKIVADLQAKMVQALPGQSDGIQLSQ